VVSNSLRLRRFRPATVGLGGSSARGGVGRKELLAHEA